MEGCETHFFIPGVVGGACSDVAQTFFEVPKFEKREKLKTVLEEGNPKDMVKFVQC